MTCIIRSPVSNIGQVSLGTLVHKGPDEPLAPGSLEAEDREFRKILIRKEEPKFAWVPGVETMAPPGALRPQSLEDHKYIAQTYPDFTSGGQ